MKRAFLFLATTAVLGLARNARASDADVAAADVLFGEARQAADAEDWASACTKFAQSYQLDPSPGALLNLGDCEEHRDHLATSWRHFRRLADSLPDSDERKDLAARRAAAVLARAPRLRISVAHSAPNMVVTRDGAVISGAGLGVAVPVDAGTHTISVRATGRKPTSYDVTIRDGDVRDLSIAVGAEADSTLTIEPTSPIIPPPLEPASALPTRAVVGWTLVGAGATSLLFGAVFGGVALAASNASDALCTGSVCQSMVAVQDHERAKAFALAADITLGVGAVFAATGFVLVLTAPKSGSLHVEPRVGGFSLGGTF